MTDDSIRIAQEYLTVAEKGNGKKRKILDIDHLLKIHSHQEVVDLLRTMMKEKQNALKDLVIQDKTKPEIDETIAVMFRVTMAIQIMKEVRDIGRAEQGTERSG